MKFLSKLMTSVRAPAQAAPQETLYEIFLRSTRRDVMKWHHYFDVYEKFMAPFRGTDVRLLEIGVARGGSLRMWREYLGPAARISGAELDPAAELMRAKASIFSSATRGIRHFSPSFASSFARSTS